jgi:sugar O-acyltransferase (sialic acid O-acetyltransferase NeuD family)
MDLLILGAGGHARVIASLLGHDTRYRVVGVLDQNPSKDGEIVGGFPVVGTFDDLEEWRDRGVAHIALAIGDNQRRADLYDSLIARGFHIAGLRHPRAMVERNATVADDAVLCIGSIIGAEAFVGANALINSGAIVDHECRIGAHAHLAPGSRLAGRVQVGDGVFVGLGVCVREGIRLGAGSQIGAGAVVVSDIPPGVLAIGIPARVQSDRFPTWTRAS